jgi:peptidyl-tRNA hydrolase
MEIEEQPVSKMYVLVRQDITPGYQIAQSIHAKDQFTHEHPETENKWYKESNTIVVLGVANQEVLYMFANLAQDVGLRHSLFYEPDIDEHTALAIEPGSASAELVSTLRSAGKGYRTITQ